MLDYFLIGNNQVVSKAEIQVQFDSIAALRANTNSISKTCAVTSYYGGNAVALQQPPFQGNYFIKTSDTTSADNGGTIIVDAVGNRWYFSKNLEVAVTTFGAKGDGVADDTAAIAASRTWLAITRGTLIFPSGIYKYSVSPNWAIYDAKIVFDGNVTLRYTGTGNAVIIDADGGDAVVFTAGFLYSLNFGWGNPPTIEAPSTALNGVFVRSAHHCKIAAKVAGCGSAYSGLLVNFSVVSEFDITVSVNETGWYLGAKPAKGITLDIRNANEQVSYCTFINPIIEGVTTGINLLGTLGNVFIGGTSEACTSLGIFAGSGAQWDRFYGTDMEANGASGDIYCLGVGLEFNNVDTEDLVVFGSTAKRCVISGGGHETILIDTGATGCSIVNTVYNRRSTGGVLTDGGTGTEITNVRSGAAPYAMALTGKINFNPGLIPNGSTGIQVVPAALAKVGDVAVAAFNPATAGFVISASVTSSGNVSVFFTNVSGVGLDLPATDINVRVFRGV